MSLDFETPMIKELLGRPFDRSAAQMMWQDIARPIQHLLTTKFPTHAALMNQVSESDIMYISSLLDLLDGLNESLNPRLIQRSLTPEVLIQVYNRLVDAMILRLDELFIKRFPISFNSTSIKGPLEIKQYIHREALPLNDKTYFTGMSVNTELHYLIRAAFFDPFIPHHHYLPKRPGKQHRYKMIICRTNASRIILDGRKGNMVTTAYLEALFNMIESSEKIRAKHFNAKYSLLVAHYLPSEGMETRCKYRTAVPKEDTAKRGPRFVCGAYAASTRTDGKPWAHYPGCTEKACPLLHKDLLCGATLK